MSFEWVIGLVGVILATLFGGAWLSRKHGRALEGRDRAEEERDEAKEQLELRDDPLPDDSEFLARLRRLQDDAD